MKTNAPTGGARSSSARSHGLRKNAAETARRRAAHDGRPVSYGGELRELPLDLRPLLLPDRVVQTVLLAVAAVRDRRLPELDAVEVRRRCVRVVLRATALLDLVHKQARLQVRGRLAERERLHRLHLRRRDVLQPQVRAV